MSYWMPPKVGLDDAKCRAAADIKNSALTLYQQTLIYTSDCKNNHIDLQVTVQENEKHIPLYGYICSKHMTRKHKYFIQYRTSIPESPKVEWHLAHYQQPTAPSLVK
jgi:hypothetical protein